MSNWMDQWLNKRVQVPGGDVGTVIGCVQYESDGQPTQERRELQVALDVAKGSSFTHFRVDDCKEVD